MFNVNTELLNKAAGILSATKNIYWVIGGACSGKSTVCRQIAGQKNIPVYDMDEHIFGHYIARYDPERHPASTAWFSGNLGLDGVLSLSWEDFDRLNRAAQAEYLDLFSDDVQKNAPQDLLLVDGGMSYPSILARAFCAERTVCLYVDPAESRRQWEESEKRQPMKDLILALPDGPKKWEQFLLCDKKIAEISLRESTEQGIKVWTRDQSAALEPLAQEVLQYFHIAG